MAIRERNGAFQVYWNNPHTGKRESRTFATREEAEKEDSLIKHRLKFERESFAKDEPQKEEITLETVYMAYLREKQFNRMSLQWQMGAMRLSLLMLGGRTITDIREQDIREVCKAHQKPGLKDCTVRGRLSVLRTVLRWAAANGFCPELRFPKLPPADYAQFIPPSAQELETMLHAAPPHLQRVIIIGSQCGVRVGPSELFSLTWEDVDFKTRLLRVHGSKKNSAATWREVPLKESLMPLFMAWSKEDKAIEVSAIIHVNGNPVASVKKAWATMLKNAGITRRIRPYDLRHAFATELIGAGIDVGTIAKLMGHSSRAMIFRHYQYVMDSQKRKAVEALPEIAHVPSDICQNKTGATELQ